MLVGVPPLEKVATENSETLLVMSLLQKATASSKYTLGNEADIPAFP